MSKVYRSGDRLFFFCPGCNEPHFYQISGTPAWQWNGSLESPTFTLSFRITMAEGRVCHLIMTNGHIQFCSDCWHHYRSQTVPIPDWERKENKMYEGMKESPDPSTIPDPTATAGPPAVDLTTPTVAPPTNVTVFPAVGPVGEAHPETIFLSAAEHVCAGLEGREVVFAKDQPQYRPLAVLRSNDSEQRLLTRWTVTDDVRKLLAQGADIYVEVCSFGKPLQPLSVFVSAPLDPQNVIEQFLGSPSPPVGTTTTNKAEEAETSSKSTSTEGVKQEEEHEPHMVKCPACGIWFNRNDPSCPNCNARTPVVSGA